MNFGVVRPPWSSSDGHRPRAPLPGAGTVDRVAAWSSMETQLSPDFSARSGQEHLRGYVLLSSVRGATDAARPSGDHVPDHPHDFI